VERAEDLAGPQVSQIVETVLRDAHAASGTATVLGVIALLFGATVVFTSLQEALNTIWAVAPKPGGHAWRYVRKRIVSFVIVLLLGVVLLFSMMAGTAVASITAAANGVVQMSSRYLSLLDTLAWFVVLTLCFAVIYKFLPDVKIAWSDVWVGSAAAALLFSIGRLLFARFLTHSAIASTFGAASSLVVFLLWVYYSAQIVLLCAEFTHIYAKRYGSGIHPDESSMRVFKRYRSA
jgi:membrane protein